MNMRTVLLLGVTFIANTLAHACSVDTTERDALQDFARRQQLYNNPGAVATLENPVVIRKGVGFCDHHLLKLRVKNMVTAHVTITTSDRESKLVNVAARPLPRYISVPINLSDPRLLKLVPDLRGYEDLHGKEFTVTPLVPLTESEKAQYGKTIQGWQDLPLDLMIPKSDEDAFDIKVNVRAEGYPNATGILTIPMLGDGILIEGFPEQAKIRIQGLMG